MLTFLKILLAVLIVVVGLVVILFYWLRGKFKKVMGDYAALAPFIMPLNARIKLRVQSLPDAQDEDIEHAANISAIKSLWSELAAQGFVQLGVFASDGDECLFVVGQHPDTKIIGLVAGRLATPPFLEFIVASPTNAVKVLSGNPEELPLQLGAISIVPRAKPTYKFAVESFGSPTAWRVFDVRMSILLIERLHAIRMDNLLARAPSLEDIQAYAAKQGVTEPLTEQQQERVLEMNRSAWIEGVRVALLDNAKRKLKLEEDSWGRLEDELIVIHQGMNADEVITTVSEHEHVERLGEQLKQQDFNPSQIFDEINRRLDVADQRQLVITLGSPIACRIFARAGVLQAAGVEPQAAGA
ncbi:MAG TPA: hypothetical protein VIU46_08780 [Gallionellaceae bacterium]